MTGHSPVGNVDIKFPALCKHISRNGINKGDAFPRTKRRGSGGRRMKRTDAGEGRAGQMDHLDSCAW